MKVVIKKVGQEPEVKEIENDLNVLQDIVGGYIECFYIADNIICICNEEGKILGLPENFICDSDIIVGDVIFCAAGEEDFDSLTDEQIDFIINIMHVFSIKIKK